MNLASALTVYTASLYLGRDAIEINPRVEGEPSGLLVACTDNAAPKWIYMQNLLRQNSKVEFLHVRCAFREI